MACRPPVAPEGCHMEQMSLEPVAPIGRHSEPVEPEDLPARLCKESTSGDRTDPTPFLRGTRQQLGQPVQMADDCLLNRWRQRCPPCPSRLEWRGGPLPFPLRSGAASQVLASPKKGPLDRSPEP